MTKQATGHSCLARYDYFMTLLLGELFQHRSVQASGKENRTIHQGEVNREPTLISGTVNGISWGYPLFFFRQP